MRQPKVTVLMPVFNGGAYLRPAVESILTQRFANLELLVIDDGSTDGSREYLKSLSDERLNPVFTTEKWGLALSLKNGVGMAKGEFVARMDADDIAVPERLEKQVKLLTENPDVGILGSSLQWISAEGKKIGRELFPETDVEIRWRMMFESPFAHPSVMFRRGLLLKNGINYDPNCRLAEDYDLWPRVLAHCQGANMAEPLLYYRVLASSASRTNTGRQQEYHDFVSFRTLKAEFPEMDMEPSALNQLREVCYHRSHFRQGKQSWRNVAQLYLALYASFARKHEGDVHLKRVSRRVSIDLCVSAMRLGFPPGTREILFRSLQINPLLPVFLGHDLFLAMLRKSRPAAVPVKRP